MANPPTTKLDADIERSLYAQREKIYPRQVHGLFATMRVSAVVVLLGLFYITAWLSWDGQHLLLFDLPQRQFHILGWLFFPQDFLLLAFALILAALSLFFFTALAGRLWCGYACPQTVWTEVFLWMERKIEGDRAKRMKLDRGSLTSAKVARKAAKHAVWLVFSLWTGFTFVGYFTPIEELAQSLVAFSLGPWEVFWILFYGLATYGNAGWLREQVCIYMCPYARFQSAMFDADTLIVSYDERRGEPRGGRKRSDDLSTLNLGSCIDCTLCVQVCPTGIDIRDGLQYQCIACASCIDVCDQVMDKMGYAPGLIRYTTQNAVSGKPSRIARPRLFVYAGLLLLFASIAFASLLSRVPLEVDVIRDRNALYRDLGDGRIENVYTLKIVNMTSNDGVFRLSIEDREVGVFDTNIGDSVHEVAGGEILSVPVTIRANADDLAGTSTPLTFVVSDVANPAKTASRSSRFLGPSKP